MFSIAIVENEVHPVLTCPLYKEGRKKTMNVGIGLWKFPRHCLSEPFYLVL